MKQQIEERAEQREVPSLVARIRDTAVGTLIIVMVGFLKWKAGLGDLYVGIGLLFGGSFISKSLAQDFLGAIKDKLR